MNSMIELLLFLSVLPSILLGIIIYKNDKIEKEPTSLLVKLFCSGIGSVAITLIITVIASIIFPLAVVEDYTTLNVVELALYCFFFVGLIEEGSKYLMVRLITWEDRNFKHIYDAIVYCVFVSLGFATLENLLYVFGDGGGLGLAIARGLLSVPGHVFFGIFMGCHYGLSKQYKIEGKISKSNNEAILTLIVPAIVHAIFDFCLMWGTYLGIGIYIIFIITLYIVSFRKVFKLAKVKDNFVPTVQNVQQPVIYNQPVMASRFCTNCGTRLEATSKFCHNCGMQINR